MVARRFSRRNTWVIVIALAIAALLGVPAAARTVGAWLITEDAPQPARAIVVLGGHLPFRALEAAALYRAGWAPEVWLTQGRRAEEEIALERLQITRVDESEYSRQVLEGQGVPSEAIHVLPERNNDTADEIRSVARQLKAVGGGRVMFVTSKFHTRRVKVLWRLLARDQEAPIVRSTPQDPFDVAHWWRNSPDARAVAREYGGILNAWAGFPVRATR